ncbi:MAG: hypothetical protein QM784_32810 [Polyangiaceae bacterium]
MAEARWLFAAVVTRGRAAAVVSICVSLGIRRDGPFHWLAPAGFGMHFIRWQQCCIGFCSRQPRATQGNRCPMGSSIETIVVGNMTNLEFFERFAALGRIGLVGGPQPIDAAIRSAQKKQRLDGIRSLFSHAFFCEGLRADGWNWVLESDIDFAPERVQIGVQESRIDKYADSAAYPHLAILDFGLSKDAADSNGRPRARFVGQAHTILTARCGRGLAWIEPSPRARPWQK